MVSSVLSKAPTGGAPRRALRGLLRAVLPCAALFLLQAHPVSAASSSGGGVPALEAQVSSLEATIAAQQQVIKQLLAKMQPFAVGGGTVTLQPGYDLHLNGNMIEMQLNRDLYGFAFGEADWFQSGKGYDLGGGYIYPWPYEWTTP